MKRLLSLVVLIASLSSLSAQITHTSAGAVDETAAKIIKKAADKMSAGAFATTVTVVNYDAARKESFRRKADLTYKSPCYRVKSDDIELICDGTTVWQVNHDAREVVVNRMADSDDDLTNPARLLASYDKNYRAKYIRQEDDGTAVIDLLPRKSRSFHKLRLFVDTKTDRLKKIEQHNYDSSRGEYSFGKYANPKLPATYFNYTFPQGYETVDMR